MLSTAFRDWEVSLCSRCEGTFYDESVLETLLRQPDLRLSHLRAALLPNLASPHPEEVDRARIDCPTCHVEMTREDYSAENPMLVDRCSEGHGIWLDDGELGHLVSEWESSNEHVDPGFIEALRRLLGMKPRVVINGAELEEASTHQDSP
jgi:Zn-finger nucleic acid-binding protein